MSWFMDDDKPQWIQGTTDNQSTKKIDPSRYIWLSVSDIGSYEDPSDIRYQRAIEEVLKYPEAAKAYCNEFVKKTQTLIDILNALAEKDIVVDYNEFTHKGSCYLKDSSVIECAFGREFHLLCKSHSFRGIRWSSEKAINIIRNDIMKQFKTGNMKNGLAGVPKALKILKEARYDF